MPDLINVPISVSGAYGIAYDFETGGLSVDKNPPLQLAMVVVDVNLKEIDAMCMKIKPVPGMVIGFFEASLIILLAVYCFQIPLRGSVGALYLGLFLFLLSGVGLGLMISSIAVTQQQGLLGAFLLLVPSVVLSGFATPIANLA